MLGVATLIVVNSVMGGFSTKLKERLHGLLSDVVIRSTDAFGMPHAKAMMDHIQSDPMLRDKVEVVTPTYETFAVLQHYYNGRPYMRPVRLIGIDPAARARLGGFKEYLVRQRSQDRPTF